MAAPACPAVTARRPAQPVGVHTVALPEAEPPSPARPLRWWRELLTLCAWYAGYERFRGASPGHAGVARANAYRLLAVERWTHLDPERALNRVLSSNPALSAIAGYYYATLHFVVTAAALVWLFRRHRGLYRRARSVLLAASAASLLVFWLFPVGPPRLEMRGIADVLVAHNVLGAAHVASSGPFVNLYAAMPSLHVGWSCWVATAFIRARASSRYRHLAWGYPVATAGVVMATGNHYLLDVAAGVAVVLLAECAWSFRRHPLPGQGRAVARLGSINGKGGLE